MRSGKNYSDLRFDHSQMAIQIKEDNAPKFDNIFVNLGQFYVQMASFKDICKFIDCSEVMEILVQAEILE